MAAAPASPHVSYTLQPAGAGGVVPVSCSDGSTWFMLIPLLSLAGYTSGSENLVYWNRKWTPPMVMRTVTPTHAGGGRARMVRVVSLEAFKDVLRRLNKGRIDAAADDAIASWAEELGVSLDGDAVAEAGGEDADDSDADEAQEAEEGAEDAKEAEEAAPALPRVPKPKGRKKLEPPTGAALGAVADARGRALRRLTALLAAAARKSEHKGLLVNYVDNAAFQEAVAAAAPPVAHFRVAHGKGTLLVPGYPWPYQEFIATNGLLRPEDKGVANMRFRFQIEAELRGRNKNINGSVLLVSLVLRYRGTSSSAVQLLNHVTGGVMSSNSLRDLLAKYLKTHYVYEEFSLLTFRHVCAASFHASPALRQRCQRPKLRSRQVLGQLRKRVSSVARRESQGC